jgi:redox-sensitive bicupin YhaK (pirin superfamily)
MGTAGARATARGNPVMNTRAELVKAFEDYSNGALDRVSA